MDTTVARILKLIDDSGISERQFLIDLGLGPGTLSEWKKGKSQSYKTHADKIADYFDTSTDYLLCRTGDPAPPRARGFSPRAALRQAGILNPTFASGRSADGLTEEEVAEILEMFELVQKQRAKRKS